MPRSPTVASPLHRPKAASRTSGVRLVGALRSESGIVQSVHEYLDRQPVHAAPEPPPAPAWTVPLLSACRRHDSFLSAHQQRVEGYVRCMARWVVDARPMSLPSFARDVELIAQAARLHDVGLVSTPRCVLYKRSPLTPEEDDEQRAHCGTGAEAVWPTLDAAPGDVLARLAFDVAIGHHERYDGSGYPRRVSGDEIGVHVQLVTVADVLDELTCGRMVDRRRTFDDAARSIVDNVGAIFGPVAVSAFAAVMPELRSEHEQYLHALDVVETAV